MYVLCMHVRLRRTQTCINLYVHTCTMHVYTTLYTSSGKSARGRIAAQWKDVTGPVKAGVLTNLQNSQKIPEAYKGRPLLKLP